MNAKSIILFASILFSLTTNAFNDDYNGFHESKTVVIEGIKYKLFYYRSYGENYKTTPHYAMVVANEENPYSGNIILPDTIISELWNYNNDLGYEVHTETFKVLEIDKDAFKDCTGLTSISIPSNIEAIGLTTGLDVPEETNPFSGCTNLASIIVNDLNKHYDSREGCNAIIRKDGLDINSSYRESEILRTLDDSQISNTLIAGCKNTVIPNSVILIGKGAFKDLSLPEISIPENILYIEEGAFEGCRNLTDVYCFTDRVISTSNTIFYDTDLSDAILHVHDVLLDEFKIKWPGFKSYIGLENIDYNLSYYVDGELYKTKQYKYGDDISPEPYPIRKGMTSLGGVNCLPKCQHMMLKQQVHSVGQVQK